MQGTRSTTSHSTAVLSGVLSTVRTLLTVLGAFARRVPLRAADVLVGDRVEPLAAQPLVSIGAAFPGACFCSVGVLRPFLGSVGRRASAARSEA